MTQHASDRGRVQTGSYSGTAITRHWPRLALLLLLVTGGTAAFVTLAGGTHADPTTYEWYNTTWHHRVGLEIETQVQMRWWPIERHMNFTRLLRAENDTGAFDPDSIRVFQYYDNGTLKREVPYQFERGDGFSAADNAHGTLIFMLNGMVPAGTNTTYFVYFDSQRARDKSAPVYTGSPEFAYHPSGDRLLVNTTKMNYTIDTTRKGNFSGITEVFDPSIFGGQNAIDAAPGERPAEYTEFTNGTHTFTFNLSRNYSVDKGPLRLTVTQRGWIDIHNISGEEKTLFLTKQYRFYNHSGGNTSAFVRIEQRIENRDNETVSFSSTTAGATALDINRTIAGALPLNPFVGNNDTDPYSHVAATDSNQIAFAAMINLNESVPNFLSIFRDHEAGRLGINMTRTTVQPNDSISHATFFTTGAGQGAGTGAEEYRDIVPMFKQQPTIVQYDAETYETNVTAATNLTVYNRGEAVELAGNVSEDAYNLTRLVNGTLNANTTSTGDDLRFPFTIHPVDPWDRTSYWNASFSLSSTANVGTWVLNASAFTEDELLFGHDLHRFTVSDRYVANITLRNDVEVAGNPIFGNISVLNVREDMNISGANISCTWGSGDVHPDNITEERPGLYSFNFTAPSPADTYTLDCNATKVGNLGQDNTTFRTEVARVVPDVTFVPPSFSADNITRLSGRNFTYRVNVSNNESGTMSSTNVTFTPPTEWLTNVTRVSCGDLTPDQFCVTPVEASIPNATRPATYDVNTTASWINPIGSRNISDRLFPATVQSNPVVNVTTRRVNGSVAGGYNRTLGDVTVRSDGNTNLTNVSFTCQAGTVCTQFTTVFDPPNVSNIDIGQNATINVTVAVPKGFTPALYNGTVNVSSNGNTSYDLFHVNVSITPKTTVFTDTIPSSEITADNVTLEQGQNLSFTVNSTNTGLAYANHTNQTIALPANWTSNATLKACGELGRRDICLNDFFLTVPNNTDPGLYGVTANSTWRNPDGSRDFDEHTLTVRVEQNPLQRVTPGAVNGTVPVNTERQIGNISVESIGNYNVSNVGFTCESGTVCQNFTTEVAPVSIANLGVGENRTVDINVSVPARFPAGNYTGTLNVSSSGGQDNVTLNVEVPVTLSWTLEPDSCRSSSDPAVGTACQPVINNTGNEPFNFTVTPSAVNNTNVTPTSFTLPFGGTQTLNATYNVTGVEDEVHNASYNVSSDVPAQPRWKRLFVTVLPAVEPDIFLNVTPRVLDQGEHARLVANITASSGFPLDEVRTRVEPPENTSFTVDMERIENYSGTAEDTSLWQLFYANASVFGANNLSANTSTRGVYTVNVSANDTIGNDAFNDSTFNVTALIRAFMDSDLTMGDDKVKLDYNLTGFFGGPIGGASVNMTVYGPEDSRIGLYKDNPYLTEPENSSSRRPGYIDRPPTFEPFAPGIYEWYTNASWFDPATNVTEQIDTRLEFPVQSSGTFDVNWDIQDPLAPGANFTFFATVSAGGNLQDADLINLTLLDPHDKVFRAFNMTNLTREREGIYSKRYSLSDNVEKGLYWAKLIVESADSRAVRFQSFRIADEQVVGVGPFDIRLGLIEHEVPQDDYLDFNVTLNNTGNEGGDVKLTYWVEDDGGTQYAYVSETIFAPANNTIVVPRNIFIYSDQPTGNYSLHAKVEPLADQSFPTATATKTFRVVQKNATEDPGTIIREETETRTRERQQQPGQPAPQPVPNISIVSWPREVNVVRGRSAVKGITVANSGETLLNNVSLTTVGIRPSWRSITPVEVPQIAQESTKTFTLTLDIPQSAELRTYNASIIASADTVSARVPMRVHVFESLAEKIRADIRRIEEELQQLRDRVRALRQNGVDVSSADTLLTEIATNLQNAREHLNASQPNKALQEVSEADSLLVEAKRVVGNLRSPQRDQAFDIVPILIGAILLLGVILTAAYFVQVRNVQPFDAVRDRVKSISMEMKRKRQQEETDLRDQKRKTKRLIELLEAQHDEGIISDESYEELRASAEEKLKRLNRKLDEG